MVFTLGAQAQFVISSGGTYSGVWYNGVVVETSANVTICDSIIGNSGGSWGLDVRVDGANLTLKRVWFEGGSGPVGGYGGGCYAWHCANLAVGYCHFECKGNWGLKIEGPGSTTAQINVYENDFVDALYGVQLTNNQNDPNISISNNRFTQSTSYQHSDQISTFQNNSGTPTGPIEIAYNLILANPDAPDLNMPPNVHTAAGIQGVDYRDYWVEIKFNTVLNGNGVGIAGTFGDNGTSSVHDNYVLGVGQNNPPDWSDGIEFLSAEGTCYNNRCGWWDAYYLEVHKFFPEGVGNNHALGRASITLRAEKAAVNQWNSDNPGCGYLYQPVFYYPLQTDFP